MTNIFSTTIPIHAKPAKVWTALTDPKLMAQWMGEPEMSIEVHTNWEINSAIFIRGFHHVPFENKGIVLHYERDTRLMYSHLSSVSQLSDEPENYSILEFVLLPVDQITTQLTLSISNFPTESILRHLEFYWRATIVMIKNRVEHAI